jgi:putative peptidoglycan lipid II flippase
MASPSSELESAPHGSRSASDDPAASPGPDDDGAAGRALTRSAGAVSIGVMVSRVLGLVREQVLAYLFSARIGLDAYYAAFRIPNLLRDMFGEGALSKAFVSTFSDIQEKEGNDAALRLVNLVLSALILVVGAFTLLGVIYADAIVALVFPGGGFDTPLPADASYGFATKRELTVRLTQIMFPFIFFVSLAALVMGVLNARGRFLIPALASSFFNVGSIVVGVTGYYFAPRFGYHPTMGMAVGVLAGGALQLLWQLPTLFRLGYRYRPVLSLRDPWLRKVMRLFGPGALIASTVQVNLLVNSIFASMGEGWLSWIMQAYRVLHLPLGLIAVAMSVATLPALSRAAARADRDGFRDTFSQATRLVIVFTVPATIGLLVLAPPIVRLIFEQGQFGPADTVQVAGALRCYAVGLLSFAAVKIVTDGFYALHDIRAPLMVSFVSILSNAGLNWTFVVVLGMDHRGLALATSATMTISVVWLWLLLRRRAELGRLDGGRTVMTLMKTVAASVLMGGFVLGTFRFLDGSYGHAIVWTRLLQVGSAIGVGVVVFVAACKALRVSELDQALAALRSRR